MRRLFEGIYLRAAFIQLTAVAGRERLNDFYYSILVYACTLNFNHINNQSSIMAIRVLSTSASLYYTSLVGLRHSL